MRRALVLLLLAAAGLAGCWRAAPPAPVVACRSVERAVRIDGASQRALSTACRDEAGQVSLRE